MRLMYNNSSVQADIEVQGCTQELVQGILDPGPILSCKWHFRIFQISMKILLLLLFTFEGKTCLARACCP